MDYDVWKDKEAIKDAIKAFVIFMIFFIFIMMASWRFDDIRYNGGYCKKCGGELTYVRSIGRSYSTTYIYKCKRCKRTIELSSINHNKKEKE